MIAVSPTCGDELYDMLRERGKLLPKAPTPGLPRTLRTAERVFGPQRPTLDAGELRCRAKSGIAASVPSDGLRPQILEQEQRDVLCPRVTGGPLYRRMGTPEGERCGEHQECVFQAGGVQDFCGK